MGSNAALGFLTSRGKVEKLACLEESMFCPHCGAEELEGAKFCAKCGTSLALPAAGLAQGTIQQDDRIRGRGGRVTFAVGKNPVAAALLSLVLPGLAIGQFYNGD